MVGHGIWQERVKNMQNEKYTLYLWNMARILINLENETHILGRGIWREKTWNMRYTQCRAWNMARITGKRVK